MAKLMNTKKETVGEIYILQELNAMQKGCAAHFETEKEIRRLLKLDQTSAPGFSYLYADGRIVASEKPDTVIGFWAE